MHAPNDGGRVLAARALGLPVPRALSVAVIGRYYCMFGDRNSILMTRLPGVHLTHIWDKFSAAQKDGIRDELHGCLSTMRGARSPYGPSRICSLSGGPILSLRVPLNFVGPYDKE
ncbi:hypothetical protein PLICRDRAFT_44723 [Plicaturopsis crispa FD-325 SS-3]|nr:hypothetical protein PLICRDRAFT_44723 [Plicaturopsis crispa FD-325 SS-3]